MGRILTLTGAYPRFELTLTPSVPVRLELETATPNELFYGFLRKPPDDLFMMPEYGGTTSLFTWLNPDTRLTVEDKLLAAQQRPDLCNGWNEKRDVTHLSLDKDKPPKYVAISFVPQHTVLALACSTARTRITPTYYDLASNGSASASPGSRFGSGETGTNRILLGTYSAKQPAFFLPSVEAFIGEIAKSKICVRSSEVRMLLEWNPTLFEWPSAC